MYNLNISAASASGNLLSVTQGDSLCTTPRTPEILNSLISMNPFDSYRSGTSSGPRLASSPPSGSDTNSTCSSGSPAGCTSPPSVQHTCSQLIKEGLKHTIQSKRRSIISGGNLQDPLRDDLNKAPRTEEVSRHSIGDDDDDHYSTGEGLTPEDEERRRRRRERNKIAATKCRLKKRERTVNLVQESDFLENQNQDLKTQIQELESEKRQLVDMLSIHKTSCTKNNLNSVNVYRNSEHSSNFQHVNASTYTRNMAAELEETTSVFRRVNMNSTRAINTPTAIIDSTMTYHRVEISSDYQRTTKIEPEHIAVFEENLPIYSRPTETYQPYEDEDIKDTDSVWRSNSGGSIDTQFGRVSTATGDSGYSCQPSITGLDSPMPFIPSEDGSPYSRSTSSVFGRPTSLDISNSDYESNVELLDSPTVPSYHHFDDADNNFCTGFQNNRRCLS